MHDNVEGNLRDSVVSSPLVGKTLPINVNFAWSHENNQGTSTRTLEGVVPLFFLGQRVAVTFVFSIDSSLEGS